MRELQFLKTSEKVKKLISAYLSTPVQKYMVLADIDLNSIGTHVAHPVLMKDGVLKEVRWLVVLPTHRYRSLTSLIHLCVREQTNIIII